MIVAAGSVIAKSVPKGSIIGGNPAKIIGDYYQYEKKVLSKYICDDDMDFTKNYKERILPIVDREPKPKMKLEN